MTGFIFLNIDILISKLFFQWDITRSMESSCLNGTVESHHYTIKPVVKKPIKILEL